MLLAFTGLRNLGLITFDSATLVTLVGRAGAAGGLVLGAESVGGRACCRFDSCMPHRGWLWPVIRCNPADCPTCQPSHPPPCPSSPQGGCPVSRRNYLYAFPERLTPDSWPTYDLADLPSPATVYGCLDETVRRVRGKRAAGEQAVPCIARCACVQPAVGCPTPSPPRPPASGYARLPHGAPASAACLQMRSPAMWLGISGGFLMCILLYMGVKGSLIIGIA